MNKTDDEKGFGIIADELGAGKRATPAAVARFEKERERRAAIKEEERLKAAALWSGQLGPREKEYIRHIAKSYNFDVTLGHIEVLGGKPYVTIKGLEHVKNTKPEYRYFNVRTRIMQPAELGLFDLPEVPNRGKARFGYWADLYDGNRFLANGFGIVWEGEINDPKAGPRRSHAPYMAETRARGRVLRQCIDLEGCPAMIEGQVYGEVYEMNPGDYSSGPDEPDTLPIVDETESDPPPDSPPWDEPPTQPGESPHSENQAAMSRDEREKAFYAVISGNADRIEENTGMRPKKEQIPKYWRAHPENYASWMDGSHKEAKGLLEFLKWFQATNGGEG